MYSFMKGSTHELASLEIAIKAIPDDSRVWSRRRQMFTSVQCS